LHPAPAHDAGIILAHPAAVVPFVEELAAHDGMDDDTNVDMSLNLHNIDDIEMSIYSAKRKRCEEGEEVSSKATAV